jgi:hypothetical protein
MQFQYFIGFLSFGTTATRMDDFVIIIFLIQYIWEQCSQNITTLNFVIRSKKLSLKFDGILAQIKI